MAKGSLKFLMLRIIAEGGTTGYGLIKRVEAVTGKKPSTGSVYPLLKSMEEEGWIRGKEREGKTVYTITKAGVVKVHELPGMMDDHLSKVHQCMSLTMEDLDPEAVVRHREHMELMFSLMMTADDVERSGIDRRSIEAIIERARRELEALTRK